MTVSSPSRLAVAIPTCSRVPEDIRLGYVLLSLAHQVPLAGIDGMDIFIWDEGPAPALSDRWTRLLIDLFARSNHTVNYLRRGPSRGVAVARKGLLGEIGDRYEWILLLDDDLVTMPGAVDALLNVASRGEAFGFLQGTKIELDSQRIYHNDINRLTSKSVTDEPVRLFFGDAAFLLVSNKGLRCVRWDVVTRFQEEGLAGEDVAITLMIADHLPCYGVTAALGYHLSLASPRWRWEASSDALQVELLRGIVSDKTLRTALPHMVEYLVRTGASSVEGECDG